MPGAAAPIRMMQADARYLAERGAMRSLFGFFRCRRTPWVAVVAFLDQHSAYGFEAGTQEYGAWLPRFARVRIDICDRCIQSTYQTGRKVPVRDRSEGQSSQTVRAQLKLREFILNGDVTAGERMSELALVDRLRVSRTPIRAALARLEQEGLLRALPTGGFVVNAFNERDIHTAIEIRGTLEGLAARTRGGTRCGQGRPRGPGSVRGGARPTRIR